MKKTIFMGFVVLLLLGGGCSVTDLQEQKMSDDFLNEYCDLYVNKFQVKDLESYGIDIEGDMGTGYYKDVAGCVKAVRGFEEQAESVCKQYREQGGMDCGEARKTRQENYKKAVSYDGCMETGRGMRCFMFDTSQKHWEGAEASQISSANKNFAECLEKVEYACSDLPR